MNRMNPRSPWGLLVLVAGLIAAPAARSDALSVVQMLRQGGCGGILPIAPPLRRNPSLDRISEGWADGHSLDSAAQGLHVRGPDEALIREQRRAACRIVSSRDLAEVGVYRRGADTWLVLATYRLFLVRAPDAGTDSPAARQRAAAGEPGAREHNARHGGTRAAAHQ
jgi:hypothetical protein